MSKYSLFLIILFGLLSFAREAHSQEKLDLYLVFVKGRVFDTSTGEPIQYAHVINPRVKGGTTTNANGIFSIEILTEDTLIIRALGYVDYEFFIQGSKIKEMYEIEMNPVRYLLKEVTVEGHKMNDFGLPKAKPLDIPIELRGNAFNEKPPIWAAFFNPISFAQYYLSPKEKGKREMLTIIKDGKEWETFANYHNLTTVQKITGLTGEEADMFMIYCNINNRLPYNASQLEIEFQIRDLYFKYQKAKEAMNAPLPKSE